MEQYGAIIIAAGLSSRMGEFKPRLPINGTTFIKQIIKSLKEAGITTIVVITGYRAEELEAHLKQSSVIFLRNQHYGKTQMFDSICIGLRFLQNKCNRIFVTPSDIPLVYVETYRKLLAQDADFVRPVYHGCYGHPVLIHRNRIGCILEYRGSYGLCGAMEASGGYFYNLPVEDPAVCMDADTPEDYRRLLKYHNEQSISTHSEAFLRDRRHILLTGPSGCGKSSLLMDALGEMFKNAGGFCTTRIMDPQGRLLGFRHKPPCELDNLIELFQPEKEGIFLIIAQKGVLQKDEILMSYSLPLLLDGPTHPLIVMDEIGGCELLLPDFRKVIYETFDHEIPCIGVLKDEQSSRNLREYGGLSDAYQSAYTEFVDYIRNHSNVSVINCTRDSMDITKERIQSWLAQQVISQ